MSLVYLLREPAEQIAPALYDTARNPDVMVIRIGVPHSSGEDPAEVIHPGSDGPVHANQSMSYQRLLEIVTEADRFMVL